MFNLKSELQNKVSGAVSSAAGQISGKLNDASARLSSLAGLNKSSGEGAGGKASSSNSDPRWVDVNSTAYNGMADWRVKVSCNVPDMFNNTSDPNEFSILEPLKQTNGVIFPITPTIQITHTAKYSAASLTHTNYAMQFYEGSEVGAININGEFPIQNAREGQYLMAAIYFFRSATKMFWGNDTRAGSPPPLLYLSGYGASYFPNVPCVLTNFSHTLPDGVDYIEVPSIESSWGSIANHETSTRLPVQSTLSITLQPIYSRANVATFRLDDFSNGKLLRGFI